jgi:excinuclease UvrABC ATPase subunit
MPQLDVVDKVLKTENCNWSSEAGYDKSLLDEQPTIPITFVAENETCNLDVQFEVHKSEKSVKKSKSRREAGEEDDEFKCDFEGCQKTFTRKLSLDVHKRSRHSAKKSSNKLTCSECGKNFASKYSLSVHVNGKI